MRLSSLVAKTGVVVIHTCGLYERPPLLSEFVQPTCSFASWFPAPLPHQEDHIRSCGPCGSFLIHKSASFLFYSSPAVQLNYLESFIFADGNSVCMKRMARVTQRRFSFLHRIPQCLDGRKHTFVAAVAWGVCSGCGTFTRSFIRMDVELQYKTENYARTWCPLSAAKRL